MRHKSDSKTDVPGIYKTNEGFLINKDNAALKAYKKRKRRDARIIEMETEMSQIKSDLQEIKDLLKGLVK